VKGNDVQTFMTRSNYAEVAQQLDDKRLGKQRVEAYQIVKALRGDYNDTGAWVNHPATVMWRGHVGALCEYGTAMCYEWLDRGYSDSLLFQFKNATDKNTSSPWWVNNQLLHMTHQSNLTRKLPEYYGGFQVPSNIPYVWPLETANEFKLGSFKLGDNLEMLKNSNVYLTSKQVAELLGISPKTISAYKARNQMPDPDKEYGRTPLWRLSTIEKWRGELPNIEVKK